MCFVWIWEQTAIISLYSINWLVCITETESVYCAVRTGSLYIIQVKCFVWIWEQTAIISLYSINWSVLGAFVKLQKIDCQLRPVCLCSHWTDCLNNWYVSIFRKSVEKIKVPINPVNNNGTLHERPCTVRLWWSLAEFFSYKSCTEYQKLYRIPKHTFYFQ